MDVKVTILDKRHKGAGRYVCFVSPASHTEVKPIFVEWREWCWENFGPGIERDMSGIRPDALWAWHCDKDYNSYRIYFKDHKELNWFKMRWV